MSFKPEDTYVTQIYDCVRAPVGPLPDHTQAALVFGRKSHHLVDAATRTARIADVVGITGAFGRDSGDLPLHLPPQTEAEYILGGMRQQLLEGKYASLGDAPAVAVTTDEKARTGKENARYGLQIIRDFDPAYQHGLESLTAVVHPTAALRLGGLLRREIGRTNYSVGELTIHASDYPFDKGNPYDQFEAANELRRAAKLGFGNAPEELLEYAEQLTAYHAARFKAKGIRNPSTADDTRYELPAWRLMLPPYRDTPDIKAHQAVGLQGRNLLYLARATVREYLG